MWYDPLTWNWSTLALTTIGPGVGAAVSTAATQIFYPLYRDRRHRKSHAAYLAMRLAVTLEAYASVCSEFIADNMEAEGSSEDQYPNWNMTLPELALYPDDPEGWRAIDPGLAGRYLNLRNRIGASQSIVSSTARYALDDLGDTLVIEAARRGLEAWDLATALRCKHGVAKVDTVWAYAESLKEALKAVETARSDSNKRMRDFFLATRDRSKPSV